MLYDNLANATKENFAIFEMSSKELEPAVQFDILLTITSRWKRNVTKLIQLLILALFADFAFLDARRCMPVATVWRAEASQRGHMTHGRQWT